MGKRIIVSVVVIISSVGTILFFKTFLQNSFVLEKKSENVCNSLSGVEGSFCMIDTIGLSENRYLASVYNPVESLSAIAIVDDKDRFTGWLDQTKPHIRDGYFPIPGEYVESFGFEEIDGLPETKEFVVQFENTGTSNVHPWYLYGYKRGKFTLLLKLSKSDNSVKLSDLDNDGIKEVIHDYSIYGIGAAEKTTLRWIEVWNVYKGEARRVNSLFPRIYQGLLDTYKSAEQKLPEDFILKYGGMINCLQSQALSTLQGTNVLVDICVNTVL